MIESLVRNLILSTPNVPSARDQISRVKRNVETYQQVNRDVRARLERRTPVPGPSSPSLRAAPRERGADSDRDLQP
jgi:hypothetical protein